MEAERFCCFSVSWKRALIRLGAQNRAVCLSHLFETNKQKNDKQQDETTKQQDNKRNKQTQ
jgi:hypothetical protein